MTADASGFVIIQILLALSCMTIFANAYYADETIEDTFAKRNYQRRSFLKTFCARRCNVGLGGNVCRCNGFHFAGKRTSETYTAKDITHDDVIAYFLHDRPEGAGLLGDEKNVFPSRTSDELTESDEDIRELLPIVLRQSLKESNLELAAKLFGAVAVRARNSATADDK